MDEFNKYLLNIDNVLVVVLGVEGLEVDKIEENFCI